MMIPSLPPARNSLQLVFDRSSTCAFAGAANADTAAHTARTRRAFIRAPFLFRCEASLGVSPFRVKAMTSL